MKRLLFLFLLLNSILFSQVEIANKDYFKNISFYTLENKETKIAPNKKMLINFSTTWCPKCIEEKRGLKNIDKEKVEVILVFLQSRDDDPLKVKEYCEKEGIKFTIFYDYNRELMKKLNIKSVPTNILLNEKGEVIEVLEDSYLKLESKL